MLLKVIYLIRPQKFVRVCYGWSSDARSKAQPHSNLTTNVQSVSSPTQLFNADPKPWTCDSIGSAIAHAKGQFHVHRKRGKHNLADYPTTNHPTKHHIAVRSSPLTYSIMLNYTCKKRYKLNQRNNIARVCSNLLFPTASQKKGGGFMLVF